MGFSGFGSNINLGSDVGNLVPINYTSNTGADYFQNNNKTSNTGESYFKDNYTKPPVPENVNDPQRRIPGDAFTGKGFFNNSLVKLGRIQGSFPRTSSEYGLCVTDEGNVFLMNIGSMDWKSLLNGVVAPGTSQKFNEVRKAIYDQNGWDMSGVAAWKKDLTDGDGSLTINYETNTMDKITWGNRGFEYTPFDDGRPIVYNVRFYLPSKLCDQLVKDGFTSINGNRFFLTGVVCRWSRIGFFTGTNIHRDREPNMSEFLKKLMGAIGMGAGLGSTLFGPLGAICGAAIGSVVGAIYAGYTSDAFESQKQLAELIAKSEDIFIQYTEDVGKKNGIEGGLLKGGEDIGDIPDIDPVIPSGYGKTAPPGTGISPVILGIGAIAIVFLLLKD